MYSQEEDHEALNRGTMGGLGIPASLAVHCVVWPYGCVNDRHKTSKQGFRQLYASFHAAILSSGLLKLSRIYTILLGGSGHLVSSYIWP